MTGSNCTLYNVTNKTLFNVRFHDAYNGADYTILAGESRNFEVWLPLVTEPPSTLHVLTPSGGRRLLANLCGKSDGDQLITVADSTHSVAFPTHISTPLVSSKGSLTIEPIDHPKYRIYCYRHHPVESDDLMAISTAIQVD
ncbi:OLC1v1018804C1 [Oldenlandia corymbosa var. corymbosa]|uniref:OLC1v1018804C1 n=1 Tax=Oldenlandia corymbosa var. corymbosa TaxID=529605 RepID=A0AAV1ECF8_OLDCO|nr:OLC1v1018804C1 [Oldenlandia corymbosa var. corymbosa]